MRWLLLKVTVNSQDVGDAFHMVWNVYLKNLQKSAALKQVHELNFRNVDWFLSKIDYFNLSTR
jgi:hypothetical protein